MNVPLAIPDIGEEEVEAVTAVLRRKWLTMGQETAAFEKEFAEFVHVPHAIAVSNCTAALHLSMLALDVGPGDEVLVPSLSFVATANSVRYVGAMPVFVDVTSRDDLNLSVDDVARKITPRTKGIIAVHYAGFPADMTALRRLADEKGLFFVEDAAQGVGSARDGVACGASGDLACFSFYSTKNATTGEGGMVTTKDDVLAKKVQSLRSHEMTASVLERDSGKKFGYDVVGLGYNFRMDEMRAALGRVQLRKVVGFNARRADLTAQYRNALGGMGSLHLPFVEAEGTSCFHLMPTILADGLDREAIATALREKGVQTSVHYRPIHQMTAYANYDGPAPAVPLTESIAAAELTLPLYPAMSDEQLAYVVASLHEVLGAASSALRQH